MEIKKQKFKLEVLVLSVIIIFIFIGILSYLIGSIIGDSNPKELTKNQAYYKCLSKTKECYDIPADRLQEQQSCAYLFINTPDSDSKTLMDYTNEMC